LLFAITALDDSPRVNQYLRHRVTKKPGSSWHKATVLFRAHLRFQGFWRRARYFRQPAPKAIVL
jgi:hypothetical protein